MQKSTALLVAAALLLPVIVSVAGCSGGHEITPTEQADLAKKKDERDAKR